MNINQMLDLQYWSSLGANPQTIFVHLLDFILVFYLVYLFSRSIAGTKIMTLIKGVFLFLLVQLLATLLGLQTISWLMNQVLAYGIIALVVIFAPELRSILEKLGRTTELFSHQTIETEERLIQALMQSVTYMVPRKIGALIAIERARTLQEYRSTGIPLSADLSGELLINIFIPNTPLHDGAVIIKEDKIAVASAYFPLTENRTISKEFGTRHRAAIGLSEVSDALVIVVSEETGGISVVLNGNFLHNLTMEEFESILRRNLINNTQKPTRWWQRFRGEKR